MPTSAAVMVMGICVGVNSSKILEERSLCSCKGKCCLEGTQGTVTLPEAEIRNCRTKSWSERLGSWSSSDPVVTNAAYA